MIGFDQVQYQSKLNITGDKSFFRYQYSLIPASALTIHKAQGVTAQFGIVFNPGNSSSAKFASTYVAASRVTTMDERISSDSSGNSSSSSSSSPSRMVNSITLLAPLTKNHFNRYKEELAAVSAEYDR